MYAPAIGETPKSSAESEAYDRARRRVGHIRGFYNHLFNYIVINSFLAVLNVLTDPSYLWFFWVAGGWGLAVAFHAYSTFATGGIPGRRWEERKIRELMERERS
jgi:hypothetical protein